MLSSASKTGAALLARGAFGDMRFADVDALWGHDEKQFLATTKDGTVSLYDDGLGVLAIIAPPMNQFGRGCVDAVRKGNVQMSVGFIELKTESVRYYDYGPVRRITEARLDDVSLTRRPGNTRTACLVVESNGQTLIYNDVHGSNERTVRRLVELKNRHLAAV